MIEDAHSSTALRADRETSGWAVAATAAACATWSDHQALTRRKAPWQLDQCS